MVEFPARLRARGRAFVFRDGLINLLRRVQGEHQAVRLVTQPAGFGQAQAARHLRRIAQFGGQFAASARAGGGGGQSFGSTVVASS